MGIFYTAYCTLMGVKSVLTIVKHHWTKVKILYLLYNKQWQLAIIFWVMPGH